MAARIRVVNPKRRPRRHRAHRRRNRRGMSFATRVRRALGVKGGALALAKRRRKYRHKSRRHHRRRAHNPTRYFARPSFRRRNPRRILGMALPTSQLIPIAGWAIAGGVATRAIPQMFLREKNTGIMGYAANAVTALGLSWLLGRFAGRNAAVGTLIGGATAIGARLITDFFGPGALQFGMSGDLDFDLGFYLQNTFPLPTAGSGPFLLQPGQVGVPVPAGGLVAPVAVAAGPGQAAVTLPAASPVSTEEPQRWGSRWAA